MSAGFDAVNEVLIGLVQRGCSAAEALDYYMAEVGPYNQSEWAEVRGVSQSTVNQNIQQAREKMLETTDSTIDDTA